MTADCLVKFEDLRIDFAVREGLVRSVDGVSFDLVRGAITALIGESGSGKTTMSNAILGLVPPNGRIDPNSRILYGEQNLLTLSNEALRRFRWRQASLVFQAAQNALNPLLTIERQLFDTVWDHGDNPAASPYPERLKRLLGMVRLDPARVLSAFPHQLSGGMRQRIIIALALILQPEFVILDEPTTALDVITQSYILEILGDIHRASGLTMLFITHDLPAVARLSDHIGVMYAGRILELSPAQAFFEGPRHPYSQGLLASIPSIRGGRIEHRRIEGNPPDLIHKPPGCVFHPRCRHVQDVCRIQPPALEETGDGRRVACHFWRQIAADETLLSAGGHSTVSPQP